MAKYKAKDSYKSAKNKHFNKSLICVPLKKNGKRVQGVTINRKLKKMGMNSSDTAEIFFDDVRVPQENLIGEENNFFQNLIFSITVISIFDVWVSII